MSHTVVGISPRNPMWLFEENFRLLSRLLPPLEGHGSRCVLAGGEGGQELDVSVLEQGPYTDTLLLKRSFPGVAGLVPDLSMKLRVYYDAGVVEVVAYQDCHRIPPRYRVVEGGRFSRDEKRQVNLLLHDLLRNCLARDFRAADSDITRA